jgi:Peptidase A4 family
MKSLFSVTSILVLAASFAVAQAPRHLQPNEHPTNLPGATTIEAPPAGFDPIAASDEDLAYHGFPPRPNQVEQPKAYATWAKAMNHSKTRMVPSLEQTGIFHGPAKVQKQANPTAVEGNAGRMPAPSNTLYSSNWSGYVDFSGASSYGTASYYYLVNDMIVPVAEQAFGACTGGWDWGSEWNGIDGWGSSDVLQAGVEFDAYCSGSIRSSYYSAWYEWYPYGEVRISSLPVAPGDEVFVEVWHTSSTQGYAYLVNYTTNQSVQVGFTAYPGYPLVGNSAEWVVERPTVNGSVATLTNYTAIPFFDAYAYTEAYSFYDIANGNPVDMESGTTVISYPEYTGPEAFVARY